MHDILEILEKDARASPEQIAAMTGRSVLEVAEAIHQAEESHLILRYKTVVDWEKAGREGVWALVEVKVAPQREVGFDRVAERIYRFPEARSVYLVSGTYDLAVVVTANTMREVAAFVSEKLASLDSVQGTVTHFLLKRYKEDGEILVSQQQAPRLPLTL